MGGDWCTCVHALMCLWRSGNNMWELALSYCIELSWWQVLLPTELWAELESWFQLPYECWCLQPKIISELQIYAAKCFFVPSKFTYQTCFPVCLAPTHVLKLEAFVFSFRSLSKQSWALGPPSVSHIFNPSALYLSPLLCLHSKLTGSCSWVHQLLTVLSVWETPLPKLRSSGQSTGFPFVIGMKL